MAIVDHLMIAVLFLVQPVYGACAYRRFVARIEAGGAADLVREYRFTMRVEWLALAALIVAWLSLGRPFDGLGFVAPAGAGFRAGLLLLAAATAYLVYAWRRTAAATPQERADMVASFGSLQHFMPHDRRTYVVFCWLSITAGVVEEILYRGFAFWYLAQIMPPWAVVGVSALAFGLAHTYQGASGVLRVTGIGIVFGSYYLLTGSIWLPIVAHAVLDIVQGAQLLEVMRDRVPPDAPNGQPA
jgi:membrane protease YdiL (CAAX protease family)